MRENGNMLSPACGANTVFVKLSAAAANYVFHLIKYEYTTEN